MPKYNFKNIRTMLTEGFTAEELRRLCYDETQFRPVYHKLAQSSGKTEIIDRLIEHSQQNLLINHLLTLGKKHNPARYKKHHPYYENLPEIIRQNPYRGLFPFREEHADVFFGRKDFTKQLVATVQQKSLVALLGASGSGKSSLVFAGLIPALDDNDRKWLVANFRPRNDPLLSLVSALMPLIEPDLSKIKQIGEARDVATRLRERHSPLTDYLNAIHINNPDHHLLLIADQFEELYTLSETDSRHQFLDVLLAALKPETQSIPLHLILTLRADFLSQMSLYTPFSDALQDNLKLLRPMNEVELRQAIEAPANLRGVTFEPGLAETILKDVSDEPGKLPLLEFALTTLWEAQSDGKLTHAAYQKIGHVEGALSRHADRVFNALSRPNQKKARRIFVQMVQPGEGTQDTRRLATKAELGKKNWRLVQHLANKRLVVTDSQTKQQETAEVAHEALIQDWHQLRTWMHNDRNFRTWQERLRATERQYQTNNQDKGDLLRGASLAEAESWLTKRPTDLTKTERTFINASLEQQRRQERLRNFIVIGTIATAIIMTILAMFALNRSQAATNALTDTNIALRGEATAKAKAQAASTLAIANESTSIAAEATAIINESMAIAAEATALANEGTAVAAQATAGADRAEAEQQARIALSRQLAAQAENELDKPNYDLALLLAIESGRKTNTTEAFTILHRVLVHPGRIITILSGHTDGVLKAQWNSNESRILTYSGNGSGHDGTTRIWDANTGAELAILSGTRGEWNSDETLILTSRGDDGIARIWDANTGEELTTLDDHTGSVSAQWNSDETLILTSRGNDGTARIWDANTGEELTTLGGHMGNVWAQWNSDETLILTYNSTYQSDDGTVRIWDADTGKELTILDGHTGSVWAKWNNDGTRILTSSNDGTIRIWDADTGEELTRFTGHKSWAKEAQWNSDETLILTSNEDHTVRIWDAGTGDELTILEGHTAWVSAQWNSDETLILTHSNDGTVRIWDADTGEELTVLDGHTGRIWQAQWNSDETRILTYSDDNTARIWDADTGEELTILAGHTHIVWDARWNSDETLILTSSTDGTARIWDVTPDEHILFGHTNAQWPAQWNSDETRILTGSHDGTARIWDASTGKELTILQNPTGKSVSYAQWNSDGSRILTNGFDGARIWDADTGEELTILSGHTDSISQAQWNSDETRILTSSNDGTAQIWDADTGTQLIILSGHTDGVINAQWYGDETRILTSSYDGTTRIWNADTGDELAILSGHTSKGWNSDETRILTSSNDGTARIWDADTGKELIILSGHTDWISQAQWNSDETRILTSSNDGTARIWDADTGIQLINLSGHTDLVRQAQWNSDETLILTISNDSTARIWDADTGTQLIILSGHTDGILHAEWNSDETRILTDSYDGTVRQYYTQMEDLLRVACERVPRNMTEEEWQHFMKDEPYRPTCDK